MAELPVVCHVEGCGAKLVVTEHNLLVCPMNLNHGKAIQLTKEHAEFLRSLHSLEALPIVKRLLRCDRPEGKKHLVFYALGDRLFQPALASTLNDRPITRARVLRGGVYRRVKLVPFLG